MNNAADVIAKQHDAINYLLRRMQEDADLRYCLLDSEAFRRLTIAYAAVTGQTPEEVEAAVRAMRPWGEARVVQLEKMIRDAMAIGATLHPMADNEEV